MSRALVISGGGCKGAFAVGVLKRLFAAYPGLSFDIFVGTSTGSLMSPLVALGEMEMVEKLYTTQKTENVVLENRIGDRLNSTSIFDASPLWQQLLQNYSDRRYDAIVSSGKKIYLTTTCLQSGQMVVFTTDKMPAKPAHYEVQTIVNADQFRKAVMASACQPVFMQPIKINLHVPGNPNPDFQFVDGGVREYAGIQMAIDNGATEIFTILLSPGEDEAENVEYKNLFSILQKTIDIFTDDVGKNDLIIPYQYNEALQYINAVKKKMMSKGIVANDVNDYFTISGMESPYEGKKPIKLYQFRPKAALGGGPGGLSFDPVEMQQMIDKGEGIAGEFIASLNPVDVTWA
jgi:predicted acylesterase/phospholipase RssA